MTRPKPLLIEIGCEEIPARMVDGATRDLARRVEAVLERAAIPRGAVSSWGGCRRVAARIAAVAARQPDREERLLGPPASVAFDKNGKPTRAAEGFAAKQGIDAAALELIDTDKGRYAGLNRKRPGLSLGEILARDLPAEIQAMTFPKMMRWGDGRWRWVRPVHWLVVLHGATALPLTLFGVESGAASRGHRFLGRAAVRLRGAGTYETALEKARVIVAAAERRTRLAAALQEAAAGLGGLAVDDPALLREAAHLVEWPAVVTGRFDPAYLDLPRELLITTLRYHQKCFSVQDSGGGLMAAFLAVSNMDADPEGHIRRGNEWVVGGRLEDARFFWEEDRKLPLGASGRDSQAGSHAEKLERVVFHAKAGNFADKARRVARLAGTIAAEAGLDESTCAAARDAARVAKADLVTGTVGEFPELQGQVGGLLLRAAGEAEAVAAAVYEHYAPAGPDDDLPSGPAGAVVSVADKLDTIHQLIRVGEAPTGSRDPFGLRRAGSGVFRILIHRRWPLSIDSLVRFVDGGDAVRDFLADRFRSFLLDGGWSANEIAAVLRPRVSRAEALGWPLHGIIARLDAIGTVREREDFALLADLTKRVDNILGKGGKTIEEALSRVGEHPPFEETEAASVKLRSMVEEHSTTLAELEERLQYPQVIDRMAEFVEPVEAFFADVLVLDPARPSATVSRWELLTRLRSVLTQCFDIRELAGQADRGE